MLPWNAAVGAGLRQPHRHHRPEIPHQRFSGSSKVAHYPSPATPTSNPTTFRVSLLNSTPTRNTSPSPPRYFAA